MKLASCNDIPLPSLSLLFYHLLGLQMYGGNLSSVRTKDKGFNRDEVAVLLTLAMIFRVQWRRLHKPEILGAEDNDVARLVC